MENYKEKIDEVLDQALTEKTFSLEIIEKIKSLHDGFASSQETIKQNNETIKLLNENATKANQEINKLSTLVSQYETREIELASKEKVAEKQAYELEYQKNRANEIKELFQIVFKNPVVRENVYKNLSGNNNYTSENGGVTKEVE